MILKCLIMIFFSVTLYASENRNLEQEYRQAIADTIKEMRQKVTNTMGEQVYLGRLVMRESDPATAYEFSKLVAEHGELIDNALKAYEAAAIKILLIKKEETL